VRFKSFAEMRDWFTGKGDDQPDAPADSVPSVGEGDEDEAIDDTSLCPAGGEHEWRDVMAATARKPLYTFCVKCRQDFMGEDV
jgi:hypothetical protein